MRPVMSIITPSFNQGQYLERTLQSVVAQNIAGLEYVIMDGGSTDSSVSILQQYGERYPEMITWISEKDQGTSDAINRGILRSTGQYVGWLNSDDVYYPNTCRKVIDFFDSHPDIMVVYGDANHIDENDHFIEQYPTQEWNWEHLLETCYISQPAAFFRRAVFERYGLLDLKYRSMDYEYWIRIGKQGVAFEHLPQLLAATRLHSEAFSIAQSVRLHHEVMEYMLLHCGSVPASWIYNYAHAVVRAKGFQDKDVFRFTYAVSIVSLYTALRWNGRISSDMFQTVGKWLGHGTSHAVERVLGSVRKG